MSPSAPSHPLAGAAAGKVTGTGAGAASASGVGGAGAALPTRPA